MIFTSDDGNFIVDIYKNRKDSTGRQYRERCGGGLRAVIDRLPESKPLLSDKKETVGMYEPFLIGATDCCVELIAALVPPENLRFHDDDTKTTFQSILLQSELSDNCARMIAKYKEDKVVPTHDFELLADPDRRLADYQQLALCCQQISTGFGLFMEQGTGKTPVGIAAVCNGAIAYRENGGRGLYMVLVAAPNNVRTNWVTEFENFATRPGRVTILKGTPVQRAKLICDATAPDETGELYYSVVIVGYQLLWRSLETLKILKWNLAMLDEAHAIKDAKAKQSLGCMEIRDRSDQRIVLTGTPISNTPLDLYNLLEFMEKGGSGFSDERNFRRFYGTFETNANGHDILTGCQNLPFLQERLARKSYFISIKEAQPNLPEKTFDLIEVEMTPNQAEAYNQLASELAVEIENILQNGGLHRSMMVQNILTQLLRLSQITSGFMSWDQVVDINGGIEQPKFYEYFAPNPKIEAILGILREKDSTEKTIIWANWIPDIEYLCAAAEQNGIDYVVFRGLHTGYTEQDREDAVRRYNEDRSCKLFVGTPGAGGVGLNLLGYPPHHGDDYDTDTTHVIHMSKDWSSAKFLQSLARGHRRGTRRPVRCTSIVVPDTIDTVIHARVTKKINTAIEVSDLRQMFAAARGLPDMSSSQLLTVKAVK